MPKGFAWYLVLVMLLSACKASHRTSDLDGQGSSVKLDPSKGVFVAVPADGAYGPKTYGGSGQLVAQSVAAAFAKKAASIRIADKHQSREESLIAAQQAGAGYLVMPTIAQWEQRATEWSGRPSRLALRLTIIDPSTGSQVAVDSVESRSRIVSFTSTSPESLLRDSLRRYVDGLY